MPAIKKEGAHFIFYPSPSPREAAQFSIVSVGHFTLGPTFALDRSGGHHVEHLIYTFSGGAIGEIAGQHCTASAGTLWLMPKDKPYTYRVDPKSGYWEGRWIEYDGAWARSMWTMMHLDGIAQIHHCTDVGRTIEEIFARLQAEAHAASHECSGLLWRAFALAERRLQKPVGPTDPGREAVELAQKFVQGHLHVPLSLDDMARAARLSPFHFARTFRRITGFTPAAYVRSLRMSRAQELLRQGGLSVKEVGVAVGYPVVQHFSTAFQHSTGMRPTQFLHLHGSA